MNKAKADKEEAEKVKQDSIDNVFPKMVKDANDLKVQATADR